MRKTRSSSQILGVMLDPQSHEEARVEEATDEHYFYAQQWLLSCTLNHSDLTQPIQDVLIAAQTSRDQKNATQSTERQQIINGCLVMSARLLGGESNDSKFCNNYQELADSNRDQFPELAEKMQRLVNLLVIKPDTPVTRKSPTLQLILYSLSKNILICSKVNWKIKFTGTVLLLIGLFMIISSFVSAGNVIDLGQIAHEIISKYKAEIVSGVLGLTFSLVGCGLFYYGYRKAKFIQVIVHSTDGLEDKASHSSSSHTPPYSYTIPTAQTPSQTSSLCILSAADSLPPPLSLELT